MKTIEFRAWHKDSGQMLTQAAESIKFTHPITEEPLSPYNQGLHLMQYSGLVDKNHQKIFAGDIIETDRGSLLEVQFESGSFLAKGADSVHGRAIHDWLNVFASWSKVIGNIYDSPKG